jgi:hypothetical protein
MNVQTIDLLDVSSWGRLPSNQEVIRVCLYTSVSILDYLSSILMMDNLQGMRLIANHKLVLKHFMKELGTVIPDQPSIPAPFRVISACIEMQTFRDSPYLKQVFTMGSLSSVNHTLLIEFMSQILKSCCTWIRRTSYPPPEYLLDECETKFKTMIKELFSIFIRLIMLTQPTLCAAKVRVEFMDPKK